LNTGGRANSASLQQIKHDVDVVKRNLCDILSHNAPHASTYCYMVIAHGSSDCPPLCDLFAQKAERMKVDSK